LSQRSFEALSQQSFEEMTMKKMSLKNPLETRRDLLLAIATAALSLALLFMPTGFGSGADASANRSVRVTGRILAADNSTIKIIGPVKEGEQQLEVGILSGKFKGRTFSSTNNLVGKIEVDKLFAPGDKVLVVLDLTGEKSDPASGVAYASVIDHYRTDKTILLAALFFVFLVIVSGWTGVKAIISFLFAAIAIVKVLLPAMLLGWDPIVITFILVALLTAAILFLVGGLSRKGLTAFAGAIGGILVTSILAFVFTYWFKIHGAVRPFAETLLYSGYAHLNLVHLFISGVFLASSGAVMDLAMDIAAAMAEIKEQQPALSRVGLIRCGFSVARHVTGTMTTTLLLAYSAEYTAMLMTFVAQGVPFENVINMVYVSSEVLHTLVGSFGLVLVAPLTAIAGGFILCGKNDGKGRS
jgi:uncharacterized membrane protein